MDDPTGIPCPECGREIVYNGNYFCSHLSRGCDWAMPEHPDPELFEACFQGLMDYRAKRDGHCPHLNVVSIVGYHKCTRCGELI